MPRSWIGRGALLLAAALLAVHAQPSGQQRESITQGKVLAVSSNFVREFKNPFAPRFFTVKANVGFSVSFEEDTLSGNYWALDTSQSDGAVQVQPTTGSAGLLPAFAPNQAQGVRFSSGQAAQNMPIVTLSQRSFSGSDVQARRKDLAAWQHLDQASTGTAYEPTGTFSPGVAGPYGKDGQPAFEMGGNFMQRRFDFKTVRPSVGSRLVWRQVGPGGAPPATGGMPTTVTFDIEVVA